MATNWIDTLDVAVQARDHLAEVCDTRGYPQLAIGLRALIPAISQGPGGDSHGKRDDGSVGISRFIAAMSDAIVIMRRSIDNKDLPVIARRTATDVNNRLDAQLEIAQTVLAC